jgi:excisionase family DNA binding protein
MQNTLALYRRFHQQTGDPIAASNLCLAHAMLVQSTPEQLLDVIRVARRLQVSDRKVYELCRTGQLAHSRIDGQIRFRPEDVERFIQRSSTESRGRRL